MSKEVWRYLITGVITTVVSLAVYYACVLTVLDPQRPFQLQIANIISWIAAVTFAFFASRRYVFESHNPNVISEGAKFFASRAATLIIDMGLMFLLVTLMGLNDKIIKVIVQVIVIVGNYVFSKFFVFNSETHEGTQKNVDGNSIESNEKGEKRLDK